MKIPRIIHQTWKEKKIPARWEAFQRQAIATHPGWEYRLWTDAECDAFVAQEYPAFNAVYRGFSRPIMRADVIRYLIMYKIGGMYLDLDYEMLRTFDFEDAPVVLPKNRSRQFGDEIDGIGNCIFASVPGHVFWRDVIDDLQRHPPAINNYSEVVAATGPLLLTRIYYAGVYADVVVPERMAFHPPSPKNAADYKALQTGGTYGIHHGWGSWKERWTATYLTRKIKKWLPSFSGYG